MAFLAVIGILIIIGGGFVVATNRIDRYWRDRGRPVVPVRRHIVNPDRILTDEFTGLQYTNAEALRVYVGDPIEEVLSNVDYVVGTNWAREHGVRWTDCVKLTRNADKWKPESLWRWANG